MSIRVPAPPGKKLFSLAGIPIAASPWFLLPVAWGVLRSEPAIVGVIWGLAFGISILVHELGHAWFARRYGLGPSVLLHGFGGLCFHRKPRNDLEEAIIVAAGPGAGLLLGFAAALLSHFLGLKSGYVGYFAGAMITINVFWSLVNLVPLWPLDGGQLLRLGLRRGFKEREVGLLTHAAGLATSAVGVIWGLFGSSLLLALMAGYLGWMNFQELRAYSPTAQRAHSRLMALVRGGFRG